MVGFASVCGHGRIISEGKQMLDDCGTNWDKNGVNHLS